MLDVSKVHWRADVQLDVRTGATSITEGACFSSEQFDGATPRHLLSTRSFDTLLSYLTVGCGCGVGGVSIAVSYTHLTLPTNREV